MSQGYEFFDARASEAAAEADVAQLDNVRDRALRSAAAWRAMADRARKTERERAARQQEREDAQDIAAIDLASQRSVSVSEN